MQSLASVMAISKETGISSLIFVPEWVTNPSPHSRIKRDLSAEGTHGRERVRFPRAERYTPHSGGPGIVPAGIMTGEPGAWLKREERRG